MDDPLAALALSFIGAVLIFTCGVFILAAVLLYLFCTHVLPPLFEVSAEGLTWTWREVITWWRRVTWRWRLQRLERQTIRRIEAVSRRHVEAVREVADWLDDEDSRTAHETAGVRSADRVAVRVA